MYDIAFRYWGIIETMTNHPGMYTLDDMRTACHIELCKKYNITKISSRDITENLDRYKNAIEMHDALMNLSHNQPLDSDGKKPPRVS